MQGTENSQENFSIDDYNGTFDIDPSTLDEKELKVYNDRGWSYGLFNKEDIVLLNQKFSQLNASERTDNALRDGTRIVDINNKLVLIGGTFENPQVHSVLVINSDNETDAEELKRGIRYETNYQRGKYKFEELLFDVQTYIGQDKVRVYSQDDFRYIKGRNETWQRATLPSNFKSYGYTNSYGRRAENSKRTQKTISTALLNDETNEEHSIDIDSDIRYAIDDEYNDVFNDLDIDLFEDEGKKVDLEKMIAENPNTALPLIYKAAAKTAKNGLTAGRGIQINDIALNKVVNKIMKDYHIDRKSNPLYSAELTDDRKISCYLQYHY